MLPVEQPRRKKIEQGVTRRMNAIKHNPVMLKNALTDAKIGKPVFKNKDIGLNRSTK